jgi:hypothetical protein
MRLDYSLTITLEVGQPRDWTLSFLALRCLYCSSCVTKALGIRRGDFRIRKTAVVSKLEDHYLFSQRLGQGESPVKVTSTPAPYFLDLPFVSVRFSGHPLRIP